MNYDTIYTSMQKSGLEKYAGISNTLGKMLNKAKYANGKLLQLLGGGKAVKEPASKIIESKIISTRGGSPFPGWKNPTFYGLGKQPHTLSPGELGTYDRLYKKYPYDPHYFQSPETYKQIRNVLNKMDYANVTRGANKATAINRLLDPLYELHMQAGTPGHFRGKAALRSSDIRGRHYKTIAELLGENQSVIDRISDVTKARKAGLAATDDYARSKVDELWKERSPKLRTFFDLMRKEV